MIYLYALFAGALGGAVTVGAVCVVAVKQGPKMMASAFKRSVQAKPLSTPVATGLTAEQIRSRVTETQTLAG